MKRHALLIAITTAILALLTIGALTGVNVGFMLALTVAGQISLVCMVISILKAPERVDKTFDEYFYQDSEIKRRE